MRLVKVNIKTEHLSIITVEYRHSRIWRFLFIKPKRVSYIGHGVEWKYLGDWQKQVPVITRAFLCDWDLAERWKHENFLTNFPSTIILPPSESVSGRNENGKVRQVG
jgi:hypothetical protein